jgi:LEA14-like dessication related protein
MRRIPGTTLWRVLGVLLLAQLFPACSLFFTPPSVEIVGVELVSLGLSSGQAKVTLEVTNEGSRTLRVRGFLYDIQVREGTTDVGWESLAEGFYDEEIEIPGEGVVRASIPVPFQYAALGAALRSFLFQGEVPYRLSGEVWLGGSRLGVQVPFRSEGVLKP